MDLYRFYDAAGQLLYVGISTDTDTRFRDHARDQSWWPQVTRRITERVDAADARLFEARVIFNEAPLYNQTGARSANTSGNTVGSWGHRLTARRLELGLSQTELGEKVGVTQVSISRCELGTQVPSLGLQMRLAAVLDMDIKLLLPRDDAEYAAGLAQAAKAAS